MVARILLNLLMDYGASTNLADNYGNLPAEMARSEGHKSLGDYIERSLKTHIDEESRQVHNDLMQGAFDLLLPYLEFGENIPIHSDRDKQVVLRALEMLDRVTEINPYNWSAFWLQGLAYRVLGKRESEYHSLNRAYAME